MNDNVAIAQAAEMGFDADCYLKRYPDVAASWDHAPATHYILYGQYEGRIPGCDVPQTTQVQDTPASTTTTGDNSGSATPRATGSKSVLWLVALAGLAWYAHKRKLI